MMELTWCEDGWWRVAIGDRSVRLAPTAQVGAKLTLAKKAWNEGKADLSFALFWSALREHEKWEKRK
jgi:hypothetical protein